ncbi:hypothetical protein NC651_013785 [Populus alba x Populus x berolinensis]|nr:hypothetical protein NC651_013785 [Populus alba x Populus x berolinensis]
MEKVNKVRCKADSRRHRVMPYVLSPCSRKAGKDCHLKKKHSKASEKKDWEGATFSVCLQHPHNAVLLVCSSYNKGCRPYMVEVPELLCPLCRGEVKGWTVVEPARKLLNAKKRTCMPDKCSFAGTYKQLRKHVKAKHPLARPRAVDPVLEEKRKKLECERERQHNYVIDFSSLVLTRIKAFNWPVP